MTTEDLKKTLANQNEVIGDKFLILCEISKIISIDLNSGRDLLIRLLERRDEFKEYECILSNLIEKTGLYPYLDLDNVKSLQECIAVEYHRPIRSSNIILHSEQLNVYQKLLDGENIILSAPTSFGKSLLIDMMIASGKFNKIVIIVPTIALIDETRTRLYKKFFSTYKIVTNVSQKIEQKTIFVLTQERYLELKENIVPDFFVIDEFYKLKGEMNDDRTLSLNSAFLNLCKTSSQFLLIGPNIENVKIGNPEIKFTFIRTDFKTVSTEIINIPKSNQSSDHLDDCVKLCSSLTEPTLIFCKSPNSAYQLANKLIEHGISFKNKKSNDLSQWLKSNFHKDWIVANLIENGIAVHHGSLPRSLSHILINLFNKGTLKFLLCTSTIIEGVNTSAKNIIIYDNKIAKKNIDYFTFNNIAGRSGRMFRHFIGRVYLFESPPEAQLKLIDIPVFDEDVELPLTLSLDMPEKMHSEYTKEQLKKIHAQKDLDVEVIKKHLTINSDTQLSIAREIRSNISTYRKSLTWKTFPNSNELSILCELIFKFVMNGSPKQEIYSAKMLNFRIRHLQHNISKGFDNLINQDLENKEYPQTATESIEKNLKFIRDWMELHLPNYIGLIHDIQYSIFSELNIVPGDYTNFIKKIKSWFLPPSASLLEEYGIPFQITLKINAASELGESLDEILSNLISISDTTLKKILTDFEYGIFKEITNNWRNSKKG